MPGHRTAWPPLFPIVVTSIAGCVAVDGGAVELSWTVRTFDGETTDCDGARIDAMRLCWESVEGDASLQMACAAPARATFACEVGRGVTGFELSPGRTAFWLRPLCVGGVLAAEAAYQTPAPIIRSVADGEVVTLNSLLVIAGDETCAP